MRAHFSYKASDDTYIPCKEAGLDFTKGDVLHIVSQDDAYWYESNRSIRCFTRTESRCNHYIRFEIGGRPDAKVIEI